MREQFQMTGFTASGLARAVGDQQAFAQIRCKDCQNAVGIAVIPPAQDNSPCTIGMAAVCHKHCFLQVNPREWMDSIIPLQLIHKEQPPEVAGTVVCLDRLILLYLGCLCVH